MRSSTQRPHVHKNFYPINQSRLYLFVLQHHKADQDAKNECMSPQLHKGRQIKMPAWFPPSNRRWGSRIQEECITISVLRQYFCQSSLAPLIIFEGRWLQDPVRPTTSLQESLGKISRPLLSRGTKKHRSSKDRNETAKVLTLSYHTVGGTRVCSIHVRNDGTLTSSLLIAVPTRANGWWTECTDYTTGADLISKLRIRSFFLSLWGRTWDCLVPGSSSTRMNLIFPVTYPGATKYKHRSSGTIQAHSPCESYIADRRFRLYVASRVLSNVVEVKWSQTFVYDFSLGAREGTYYNKDLL
jgi:hypothetical protein